LCLLNKTKEIPLTLMESFLDSLDWVLRELFILYHKVMQVISEVVSTCRASMSIKHSEEANLRPLNIDVGLILWLENIQNDGNPIFIIVSDDTLVGVSCIRLNNSTFLLTCFRWFMIFKLNCLGVQRSWVFTKQ
jgi:hypothetical protein